MTFPGPPPRRALALIALIALPVVAETNPLDLPTKQWRLGPPRYLLTRAEDQRFKELQDDGARAAFVEAFWRRRDPTPRTEPNEFYQQFWDRVERTESLRLYLESTKPMWLTDPGKWYILLGPPDEERRDAVATSSRDTVTWIYRGVPGVPEPICELVFVADEAGEMRLEQVPSLDRSILQGLSPAGPTSLAGPGPASRLLAAIFALGAPSLGTLGGPSANPIQEPLAAGGARGLRWSERDGDATAGVRAGSALDTFPMEVHADYYRAADGTTYAAFTLAPREPSAAELVPFGGIISLDDERVTYPLSRADQFAAAGPGAPQTFQTGLGLDRGRYRVLFGLEEAGSGRVASWKDDITVPDLASTRLSLSSLTLARELVRLPGEGSGTSFKVPFVLGSFRVVPRADAVMKNGDEFQLYYQVYGAERAADGQPALDVRYRFDQRLGEEWVGVGPPIEMSGLTGEAQAWSFPIQGWPLGTFRLTVTVIDRHADRSVERALEFVLTG